jgi:hypothetical protein
MRLRLDTSEVARFIVSRTPAPKTNRETGQQRADTQTGELLFTVQVMALDDTGGDVLAVTVPGEPKVSVGQDVRIEGLVATYWEQNGRSGVAFRAASIAPVDVPRPARTPAA